MTSSAGACRSLSRRRFSSRASRPLKNLRQPHQSRTSSGSGATFLATCVASRSGRPSNSPQAASDPLKRLGELQVEAARQHRLGVRSLYFPSVATQFLNLHLSEQSRPAADLSAPVDRRADQRAAHRHLSGSDAVQRGRHPADHAAVRCPSTREDRARGREHRQSQGRDARGGRLAPGREELLRFARRRARTGRGHRRRQEGANGMGDDRRFRSARHGGTAGRRAPRRNGNGTHRRQRDDADGVAERSYSVCRPTRVSSSSRPRHLPRTSR